MAHLARVLREKAQLKWPGAIVVERGPGHIKHRHPTDPNQFMLDSSVGPTFHYGSNNDLEIDSAWLPGVAPWDYQMVNAPYNAFALANFSSGQIVRYVDPDSGEDIAFQPQQLQWTNDLDQIQAIANPQAVNAVVQEEDKLFWQGAYGAGLDFTWYAEPVRLAKKLKINALANLPVPNATIIAGGNPVLRLRFIFQVSNRVDVYVNGVLWNKNTRVSTSGLVEFRLAATGQALWVYDMPHIFSNADLDPDGEHEFIFEERLYRTGPNLFIEIRVPWNWIQVANFPIVIDPTINSRVNASNNDAWEPATGNTSIVATTGNPDGANEWDGSRHNGITISGGAIVTESYLTLYFASSSLDEPDVTITGEKNASPGIFVAGTGNYNISGRTDTTASVDWANANLGAPGAFNTSSLNTIIQELINAYAPYSSGYIVMMWRSRAGDTARDCDVTFYDGDTANAPLLHIVWEEGRVPRYPSHLNDLAVY